MRPLVGPFRSPSRLRLAGVIAVTALTAGCSSESSRFSDTPFANPFRSGGAPSQEVTGSIPAQRSAQVETRPLPQAGYQPYQPAYQAGPPPASRPASVASTGTAGGGRGMASYQPAATPAYEVTGSVRAPATQPAPLPRAAQPASSHWTWEGGTPITATSGDTLESIANRYGVPAGAIAQANGLTSNAPVYPGQRIVIPRYNYSAAPAQAAQAAPQTPARPVSVVNTTSHRTTPVPSAKGTMHVVSPGETLTGIARRYGKPVTEIAAANNIQPHHMVRMGDRLVIPGARTAYTPQSVPAAPSAQAAQPPRMAAAQPLPSARLVTPAADTPVEESAATAESASAAPGFRWPVRGRIITGFGPKPTGQQNDGINLAVPEGTPIKAAEDGIVAYAGNELKGYGNLVLIRHANGFVTAYAHASELMVKRGDTIKRGQVIAKSGQTGNVSSPQLHFEIRKGSTPVDPLQHLQGAG